MYFIVMFHPLARTLDLGYDANRTMELKHFSHIILTVAEHFGNKIIGFRFWSWSTTFNSFKRKKIQSSPLVSTVIEQAWIISNALFKYMAGSNTNVDIVANIKHKNQITLASWRFHCFAVLKNKSNITLLPDFLQISTFSSLFYGIYYCKTLYQEKNVN